MKTRLQKSNKKTNRFSSILRNLVGRSLWLMQLVFKKTWKILAVLLILMAITFSVFRALTPWVKQYKGNIEQRLSVLLGQPVKIHDLETTWYWFQPVLRMSQVTVSDQHDHTITLNKILIGIDLFRSLWHWQVQPGVVYADSVQLNLRQAETHWEIDGLNSSHQTMKLERAAYLPTLQWLLSQHKIVIKNVDATFHFNDGSVIPLKDVNLTSANSRGHYRVSGQAELAQSTPTALSFMADIIVNPQTPFQFTGTGYIGAHHLILSQWRKILGHLPYEIKDGQGDVEIWFDIMRGQLTHLQSKFDLAHLAWKEREGAKVRRLQRLAANAAWQKTANGWRATADHVELKARGFIWPENSLAIEYKELTQEYQLFIQTVLLDALLANDIAWPNAIHPLLHMAPRGELQHLQIGFKEGQLDYILTKFSQLSWRAREAIPAVKNISGVLYWQPTEGRLELDGENTVIAPQGLPPVTFQLFNAAFDWKQLSDGLRVSLERFVLSHPNLLLSARGALDHYGATSPASPTSNVRLTAEFAAKEAEKWLPYLPSQYLKPKLDTWLKQDIKRIAMASGRIVMNGPLADFPYDNKKGEFSITSHLNGVDLLISPDWPLNRDIDAELRVNQRQLTADIFHAQLQGALVDKISLVIPGIGLGKEKLLIHGEVQAPAALMKEYVFASPLRQRLNQLKQINIDDLVGLNLELDIPLYPERDEVLAQGVVYLDDNPVTFLPNINPVKLEHITGVLRFDEHGLRGGGVQGTFTGEPINLQVQTIEDQEPYTELKVQASTTIDQLRQAYHLPILALLDGHINFDSTLTMPINSSLANRLHIASSLEGITIDAPAPIGKAASEAAPFAMDFKFSRDNTILAEINYLERLNGKVLFAPNTQGLDLAKGEIHIGHGLAQLPQSAGMTISGTLPLFDVKKWQHAFAKLPQQGTSSSLKYVSHVDVKIEQILWGDILYHNVAIDARQLPNSAWAIKLNESNIVADLIYQPKQNLLTGNFKHIIVDRTATPQNPTIKKIALKPEDIPNLDITVEQLKWGKTDVGSVSIKSESTPSAWTLHKGEITTSDYRFMVEGQWHSTSRQNNTQFNGHLTISDLSKSLERWHITPAVQAHAGDIRLAGQWPGGLDDFALAKIDGTVDMQFKNGRISHFNAETEEKLGLGKLLSILSLQTIPRRLKLDFSDLSEQGYSFDIFKGHFDLKKGILRTQDSYIDGPIAYASMKGDLDVIKRLYDLDLRVSPYIGASLPVVATIAGGPVAGPIAGLATWVAINIINKGMQKISGYTYKISGPWLDPVVQQVSIDRKK